MKNTKKNPGKTWISAITHFQAKIMNCNQFPLVNKQIFISVDTGRNKIKEK